MDVMRLTYNSSISDIHEINSSFDAGILRICYTGANRNKTYFSKDTLEKCMPTLYNCPIVCNYKREDGSIGGHDVKVITDYDDQIRLINLTQPVGVIPESAKVYFENIEEDDGTVHEYLCSEVILWKRQEAYKAIKENGITSESMEINVIDGEKIDDVYVINKFEFTAFALLGDVEPCFESASLQTFSLGAEFKEQFTLMMDEFKETFNLHTTSSEVEDTKDFSKKGGCEALDGLENFEAKDEVVDEVTEETVETVDEKFEAQEDVEETAEEEFALNSNIEDELYAAIGSVTIQTEWGPAPQYFMQDYDVEAKMVYCWDCVDWLLYGFAYEMNGDKLVIDFDSKKRMKFVIVEFDEGEEQNSPFAGIYEKMKDSIDKSNDKISDLESKYQAEAEKVSEMEGELQELRQYKSDVEHATAKAEREELFAQFADINEIEEFVELVANSDNYDLDALEEKCFAIRGRNMKLNFSNKETKAPKLPVSRDDKPDEEEPYGGVVAKYLK